MVKVLSCCTDFCEVYIDDIIVFSANLSQHLTDVRAVFNPMVSL